MTAIVVILSGLFGRACRGLDDGVRTGGDRHCTLWAETKWRAAGSSFLVSRGMRTCSQGKKVADGRCGRGDRDEVVLRSHQIHRGLRGCAPLQSSKEHRSWPGVCLRSPTATAVMAPLAHDGSRLHGPPCQSIPHRRPIRVISPANALTGTDRMAALASAAYSRTSGRHGFQDA